MRCIQIRRVPLTIAATFVCLFSCSRDSRVDLKPLDFANEAPTPPQNTVKVSSNSPQSPFPSEPSTAPTTTLETDRKLTILVRGFDGTTGSCRIALYLDESTFNLPEKAGLRSILPIRDDVIQWELSQLEVSQLPETIAIAAYQDGNDNEKLDKNTLGIPTERYGFSNNPKRGFGPPSFQQAKWSLQKSDNSVTIELR